jgi:hypothetical protein
MLHAVSCSDWEARIWSQPRSALTNETAAFAGGDEPIVFASQGGGGPTSMSGDSRENVGVLCGGNTREKRFEVVDVFSKEVHIRYQTRAIGFT